LPFLKIINYDNTKRKAKELVNNFSRTHVLGILNTKGKLVTPYSSGYASVEVRNIRAKNSALIAVDLAIEYNDFHIEFLQEVKKEIEKL
jgi:hypothetical protein